MAVPYRAFSRAAALIALLALSSGCGSSGSPVALANIPRNLSYPQAPLSLALGVTSAPAAPNITGVATQWKVAPQLPLGLALDPTSGTIAGTPKTLSAKAAYKVTAIGNYGSTTANLEITVSLPAQDAILSAGRTGLVAVSTPGANVGTWLPPTGIALGASPRAAAFSPFATATLVLVDGDQIQGEQVQAVRVAASTFAPSLAARSPVVTGANAIAVQDELAIVCSGPQQKVAVYRIDAKDGALTAVAQADTELDPGAVAVARDGRDVLVLCRGSETLMRFRLDRDAGTLLLVEQIRLGLGASALAVQDGSATSSSAGLALVTDTTAGRIDAFSIDAANGDLRALKRLNVGGKPFAVVIDPTLRRALVLGAEPRELIVLSIGQDLALTESARVALTDPIDSLTLSVDAREVLLSAAATGILRTFAFDTSGALVAGRATSQLPGTNVVVSLPTAVAAPVLTRGMLAIDQDAGTLVEVPATGQGRVFRLGAGPSALALDRTNSFALLACRGDDTLWRVRIDPVAARITTIDGPVAIGGGLAGLVIDPAGRFAYVSCDRSNEIVTIALTGALPAVVRRSIAGIAPRALAIDPHGRYLAAVIAGWAQLDLYYIDPRTGIPLGISYATAGGDPKELTFDLGGRHVYVASAGDQAVLGYAIDQETGALSKVADRALTSVPSALVASEEGLAVAENGSSLATGILADAGSGSLLASETVVTQAGVTRLVAEASRNGFWVVAAGTRSVQRIGRAAATGKLTVLETVPLGFVPRDLVVVATR